MLCIIKKCNNPASIMSMCTMHHRAFYAGKDLGKHINRQEQEYRTDGDITYVMTYDKYGNDKEEFMIDTSDIDKVRKYVWFTTRKYVVTRLAPSNKFVRLHRYILGEPPQSRYIVDHKNNNPLDNRKENLRRANLSQNSMNRSVSKGKDFKGVMFSDSQFGNLKKKWRVRAQVSNNGLRTVVEVGRFTTPEEAAWMYDQYALELHGEFAKTNFEYV